jgi:hypothetical protein
VVVVSRFFFLERNRKRNISPPMISAATGMPTPMPTFAPVPRPLWPVGVGVGGGLVEEEEGLLEELLEDVGTVVMLCEDGEDEVRGLNWGPAGVTTMRAAVPTEEVTQRKPVLLLTSLKVRQ